MKFSVSDPLSLVAAQSGLAATSTKAAAGGGNQNLTAALESVQLGEPVPIVFCRRRTVGSITHGGVYIEPKATEARFEVNESTLALSFAYLLVLSEGDLPLLQVQDIYQHTCREGDTFNQKYDGRAGTWTPSSDVSNITAGLAKYNVPAYLGTGGSYKNLTTLSYEGSSFIGDRTWSRKIFVAVKEGMKVTRLIDDVSGPSDNFVDLVNYLLSQAPNVASDSISTQGFTDAAEFTDANGFFFNGVLKEAQNLGDWIQSTADNFLLRFSQEEGKYTFKPRLPANSDGTINTGVITPEYTFTEEHLLPDGFEIEYLQMEDRAPVCAVMLWRQQPGDDFGIVRSTEVRFQGEAVNGPFVQYDLSEYCTTENHAIKVGIYHLARRKAITHNLRVLVRAGNYAQFLSVGDIVRVRLRRETSIEQVSFHDKLYEIERIERSSGGQISYDLTHFPIDSQGRSIVARAVDAAVGRGVLIASAGSDLQCGTNYGNASSVGTSSRYNSNNLPDDVPDPGDSEDEEPLPEDDSSPPYGIDNPTDPIESDLDNTYSISGYSGDKPVIGDTLEFEPGCSGAYTEWYGVDNNTGEVIPLGSGLSATLDISNELAAKNVKIYGVGRCPDPDSPDGFGDPIQSDTIDFYQSQADHPTDSCRPESRIYSGGLNYPNFDSQDYVYLGSAFPSIFRVNYEVTGTGGGIIIVFNQVLDGSADNWEEVSRSGVLTGSGDWTFGLAISGAISGGRLQVYTTKFGLSYNWSYICE